ncbi:hypothetical protein FGIG_11728 [Fasciola gigantica]|uniref:Uncharacterized protein n=1 Tax=Fasciola gigantica TaxID=46835 RepID=A0A504YQR8_FASGI|nr:hypothetical protein FGIG_11728 [Fasciola gigantica]
MVTFFICTHLICQFNRVEKAVYNKLLFFFCTTPAEWYRG